MFRYLGALLLLSASLALATPLTEREAEALHEELQVQHADLLRGNFTQTDFTGRVRVQEVSVHQTLPPGYVVLAFRVEVLERFKGSAAREITYLHLTEGPRDPTALEQARGKTGIVSLFRDRQSGDYSLGDNGYHLPDTPHLRALARELAQHAKPR